MMPNVGLEFLLKQEFKSAGVPDIYSKRIHERIYIEYDLRDDFTTLVRFEEIEKYGIDRVKITIPRKIKTKQDLLNLLNILQG